MTITHSCYYCGLLFETKEKLFDHVDIHSYKEINDEIMARKKEQKKKEKKY